MRVVAIFNIKGGVGKTASAVSLAYLAAAEGSRTLLWDLDPRELWSEIRTRMSAGETRGIYAKSTRKALESAARNGAVARAHDVFSVSRRADR